MPDPSIQVSTDGLIDRVRELRNDNPNLPLAELLVKHLGTDPTPLESLISQDRLVDLVCIDLIQQRRSGFSVQIEDYLAGFPSLTVQACLLDLIDSEICIRRELDPTISRDAEVTEYTKRFPKHAEQIVDLISLSMDEEDGGASMQNIEPRTSSQEKTLVTEGTQLITPQDAGERPFEESSSVQISFNDSRLVPQKLGQFAHPIDAPEWFVGEHCIATSPGCWLVRGRDSSRGQTMVMKILEFAPQAVASDAEVVLDVCERASKVTHPAWIKPCVAATQNRNLAVIRPWQFGRHWQSLTEPNQLPGRLQNLATVAYALQAAHRIGAVHGGIHPRNVLLDHQDKVFLVDAGACSESIVRWMEDASDPSRRQAIMAGGWHADAQGLIRLVAADAADSPGRWSKRLISSLHRMVDQHQSDCCGTIGDELLRRVEQIANDPSALVPTKSHSWRSRLASWLSDD